MSWQQDSNYGSYSNYGGYSEGQFGGDSASYDMFEEVGDTQHQPAAAHSGLISRF